MGYYCLLVGGEALSPDLLGNRAPINLNTLEPLRRSHVRKYGPLKEGFVEVAVREEALALRHDEAAVRPEVSGSRKKCVCGRIDVCFS
jgi:hypothetical protein